MFQLGLHQLRMSSSLHLLSALLEKEGRTLLLPPTSACLPTPGCLRKLLGWARRQKWGKQKSGSFAWSVGTASFLHAYPIPNKWGERTMLGLPRLFYSSCELESGWAWRKEASSEPQASSPDCHDLFSLRKTSWEKEDKEAMVTVQGGGRISCPTANQTWPYRCVCLH